MGEHEMRAPAIRLEDLKVGRCVLGGKHMALHRGRRLCQRARSYRFRVTAPLSTLNFRLTACGWPKLTEICLVLGIY